MYAERILEFGSRFQGRLNDDLLAGALDYVRYSEEALAFELLCDHIWEHDVLISEKEYGEAIRLALGMGLDLREGPFKHLERLRDNASR